LVTRRRIRDTIEEALDEWEPRIIVDRVEVWELEDQPDAVRVEIVYRLIRTNVSKTLMLTMNVGT
jgi:hypothetical protein